MATIKHKEAILWICISNLYFSKSRNVCRWRFFKIMSHKYIYIHMYVCMYSVHTYIHRYIYICINAYIPLQDLLLLFRAYPLWQEHKSYQDYYYRCVHMEMMNTHWCLQGKPIRICICMLAEYRTEQPYHCMIFHYQPVDNHCYRSTQNYQEY